MDICIKNGTIVDWSETFIGDIYIKNGKIAEIGKNLNKDCKTIDAEGKVVMPSFVDLHVHFRDPGFTYKEDINSGSHAAVKGGYTMVNLMANTKPVCSDFSIVNYAENKAKEIGLVDINQVMSITKNFSGSDISHLDSIRPGEVRIISEDGHDVLNSEVMIKAMAKAHEKNITVMCHCENQELSNIDMRLSENTMTWRNITLAKYTGCKLHIAHVSTKESINYIINAKESGQDVTCEVTPHHLALTEDTKYTVNPPLRTKDDIAALIDAITMGYVDCISTDHAPHTAEDKLAGSPGISGIETAFSVCYTKLVKEGHITLNKLSELMSKRPSEILGVKKGIVDNGFDGDLVILALDTEYTINKNDFLSKGKNTPFDGHKVYGKVLMTIKNGDIVYSDAKEGILSGC